MEKMKQVIALGEKIGVREGEQESFAIAFTLALLLNVASEEQFQKTLVEMAKIKG